MSMTGLGSTHPPVAAAGTSTSHAFSWVIVMTERPSESYVPRTPVRERRTGQFVGDQPHHRADHRLHDPPEVRQTRRPVRPCDAVLVAVPAQSLTLTTLALSTDSSCGLPLIGHTMIQMGWVWGQSLSI